MLMHLQQHGAIRTIDGMDVKRPEPFLREATLHQCFQLILEDPAVDVLFHRLFSISLKASATLLRAKWRVALRVLNRIPRVSATVF